MPRTYRARARAARGWITFPSLSHFLSLSPFFSPPPRGVPRRFISPQPTSSRPGREFRRGKRKKEKRKEKENSQQPWEEEEVRVYLRTLSKPRGFCVALHFCFLYIYTILERVAGTGGGGAGERESVWLACVSDAVVVRLVFAYGCFKFYFIALSLFLSPSRGRIGWAGGRGAGRQAGR